MITDSNLYIEILWFPGDDILIYLSIDGRPAEGSRLLDFLLRSGTARITKMWKKISKKRKKFKKHFSLVLFHLFSKPTNQHETSMPALATPHTDCATLCLSLSLIRSLAHSRLSLVGCCRYCHHCCHVA